MFINFDEMPENARLWVYRADRSLSEAETGKLEEILSGFTQSWDSHGQDLRASFTLAYDRLVVLAADENFNPPSGCSIDKSVALFREAGEQFGTDFFVRTDMHYLENDEFKTLKMSEIKPAVAAGKLSADTPVFDTLLAKKSDWENRRFVPAGETWLKRYFK